jgi:hypothetical protein
VPQGVPQGVPSSATTAQKISVLAESEAGSMSDILLFLPVWGTLEPPGGPLQSFAAKSRPPPAAAALDETQAKMYTHLCLNELCLVLESRRSPGIAAAYRGVPPAKVAQTRHCCRFQEVCRR